MKARVRGAVVWLDDRPSRVADFFYMLARGKEERRSRGRQREGFALYSFSLAVEVVLGGAARWLMTRTSIDFISPPLLGHDYQARYFAEEHALFDTDAGFAVRAGDQARLVCGYAPTTVNLHDVLFAVEGDRVADVWPVFPRGPQHWGFLSAFGVR